MTKLIELLLNVTSSQFRLWLPALKKLFTRHSAYEIPQLIDRTRPAILYTKHANLINKKLINSIKYLGIISIQKHKGGGACGFGGRPHVQNTFSCEHPFIVRGQKKKTFDHAPNDWYRQIQLLRDEFSVLENFFAKYCKVAVNLFGRPIFVLYIYCRFPKWPYNPLQKCINSFLSQPN